MKVKTLQMKRALRTVLLVLLLNVVGMGKGYAQDFDFSAVCSSGQRLYYKIIDATNHHVKLTYPNSSTHTWYNYTAPTGNLVLPSDVIYDSISYDVVEIGEYAFVGCKRLYSITIPNSVTSIGYRTFHFCEDLSRVYYTGSIEQWCNISWGQGYSNPLCYAHNLYINNSIVRDLTIPTTVTEIKPYAFNGATCLTSLTIPNSVISIGDYAFKDCSGFTGNLTIPNSVTMIGSCAFMGCSGFTGNLTIGNSVTSIYSYAFKGCSGITEVYYNAINCGNISSLTSPFSDCSGTLIIGNDVERIPAEIFSGCSGFTGNLTIGNSVTTIGHHAFQGCGFTGDLTIPNSVTLIGDCAFHSCSGFTGDLTIPDSVTSIGSSAFAGCSGFTGNLTIGNSITTIDTRAFHNCSGFGSLTIGNSVTTMAYDAFGGCSGITEVYYNAINCEYTGIGQSPFYGCSGTLTIGNDVERIPAEMFSYCSGFTGNLTIPDSVTSIGDAAFNGCSGFTGDLIIPNSVTSLEGAAFVDCSGFTSLTLGSSIDTIGVGAFSGCTGLTGNLVIPNSVSMIDNYAFNNCSGLTTLTLGNSVAEIHSYAFRHCSNLDTIVALGTEPPTLENGAFYGLSCDDITLMVPCGSLEAYCSNWNGFGTNNTFEDCNEYPIEMNNISAGGNVTTSTTEAAMGEEVRLTVVPNAGMSLSSLVVCNATDPSQIVSVYSIGKASSLYGFIMPPFAVSVSATFVPGTSVGENHSISIPASVYPNPTSGQVTIEVEGLKQIIISNTFSQIIYEGKANGNSFEYDFGKHDAGVYIVRIETTNGVATKRVVVSR